MSPAAGFGGSVVRGCTQAGPVAVGQPALGLRAGGTAEVKGLGCLRQTGSERLNGPERGGAWGGQGGEWQWGRPWQHRVSPCHSPGNSKGQKGSLRGVREKEAQREAGTRSTKKRNSS